MAKSRVFVGDFETTVYKGQAHTEVWASASVELFTEDVQIFHSIGEQLDYFISLNTNIIVYYHNLKFDGAFWLSHLLVDRGFTQAYTQSDPENINTIDFDPKKDMKNNTITYCISDMGQWYKILIKVKNHFIEIRDSLKLLPFTVKRIGQSFKTKHKKLDMEYKGFRYAGCEITDKEREYIANDVLVIKEAMEIMLTEGHNKLTIGSCCLHEYRQIVGKHKYGDLFPDMTAIELDKSIYGNSNADEWIRRAYKGGWCYVAKGKEKRVLHNGFTADVNSLYPSMMHSESGNRYPVGSPTFWNGDFIPEEALYFYNYYFIRVKTQFKLKDGYLPFIQLKNNLMYRGNECLETSDILSVADGKYYDHYVDFDGNIQPATVELTLTCTDWELVKEHYHLYNTTILGGCYFKSKSGIFDEYIDKYRQIKVESKGAKRELAKLFLNNLYGKMASNTNSSFKFAVVKEDNTIGFINVTANDKKAGYIPVGAAITSYARNFTIRAAQANYHGADKGGFCYADTDSIHCDIPIEQVVGIKTHPTAFCCWKIESYWDVGWFVRQKTYIEHITHEDGVPMEQLTDKDGNPSKPYYNVKCAGMPDKCKNLFIESMSDTPDLTDKTEEEKAFLTYKQNSITDFNIGLVLPGKLMPKRIRGGIVLVDTLYEMRAV